MRLQPQSITRTATLFPYTTLFRSGSQITPARAPPESCLPLPSEPAGFKLRGHSYAAAIRTLLSSRGLSPGPISLTAAHPARAMGPGTKCRDGSHKVERVSPPGRRYVNAVVSRRPTQLLCEVPWKTLEAGANECRGGKESVRGGHFLGSTEPKKPES